MHKSAPRFFGDNREISNNAVKGVPFSVIFVGIYEGTILQSTEVSPMTRKARRGKKHETAGIRIPAIKRSLRKQRKCTYTFRIFGLAPKKSAAVLLLKTALPHRFRLPPEPVIHR